MKKLALLLAALGVVSFFISKYLIYMFYINIYFLNEINIKNRFYFNRSLNFFYIDIFSFTQF